MVTVASPHAKATYVAACIGCTCVPQEHLWERSRRGRTEAFVVGASCEGRDTAHSTAKTVSGPTKQPIPWTRWLCVVLVGTRPFGRLRAGRGVEESLLRGQWLLMHASRGTAAVKKRHWMCEELYYECSFQDTALAGGTGLSDIPHCTERATACYCSPTHDDEAHEVRCSTCVHPARGGTRATDTTAHKLESVHRFRCASSNDISRNTLCYLDFCTTPLELCNTSLEAQRLSSKVCM